MGCRSCRGRGLGKWLCPLPRKFFITYSRKGAFWWIPDVLILKLWFAVQRMLQGCATDSVSSSPSGCSCLSSPSPRQTLPMSAPFLFPTLLPSLSFPFLLLPRQIDEVSIRCGCSVPTVMCTRAYTSAVPSSCM